MEPEEPERTLSAVQHQEAVRALLLALEFTELSRDEIEAHYCAIGGNHPHHLSAYLRGDRPPSAYEYNVLAQVFNDAFTEYGQDHPVPYAEQLPTDDPSA